MKSPARYGALLCWLLLFGLGAAWIGRQDYLRQYDAFSRGTSIAQRMLSQKTVQHEAVLATLAALSHPPAPERLYPSLRPSLPQLLGLGQLRDGAWAGSLPPPAGLDAAVALARARGRPVTLPVDAARCWLVAPSSWSLLLDARQLLQDGDFPDALASLSLSIGPEPLRLLARQDAGAHGWTLSLQKPLGAASQPFALRSERVLTPASWPWAQWLAWAAASALLVAGAAAWRRGRAEALRQREQARVAAMERLGTLGEMAAGIAHELNQPLTAILAQTRAAERMLDDEDERPAVREALRASAGQAAARPTSSPACALVRPSAPAARERWIPRRWRIRCASCASRLARQGVRLAWRNDAPANVRWATAWRWNRSCTTWCRTPSTRWPACAPAPPARG